MTDYIKNMLIGLFVVVACSLVIGIILFLEPSVGDGKQTLVVRFSNINGLPLGTRVMFAGKPVGEVVEIQQIPHAREQPTDELGQVYFYQLILKIDSSVRTYNTDEVTVQTSGLLGEKSIAIIPRAPPKGIQPTLITANMPIYAESIAPLESAFNELRQLSDKVEETLDKVTGWMDQNTYGLNRFLYSLDEAITEASITLSTINQNRLVQDLQEGVQNFSRTMKEIHHSIEQIQGEGVFANFGTILRNARQTSSALNQIICHAAEGKGSIGQWFMRDDTYLYMTSILSKWNTMMNDVNHYGLLFNLNKEWQRSRLKWATWLNALETPGAFRNYCAREVDFINTSISRLSTLVDRAENSENKKEIFKTQPFQHAFAELMRNVQALHNNLKLYNEHLEEVKQGGT